MIKTNILQSLRHGLCLTSALGFSAAICAPAQAGDANTLPQNPNVTAGAATFAQSGNTLTVNQTSNRTVIDWRSFDIGANAQATFNQPGSSAIAVNRVNAGTDPTRIDGGLSANGQVWILNPNGVLFGSNARVNAAGIVASTANIDTSRFMAGDNRLIMTGADTGSVGNAGHISVGDSGLAAFVAPSVRNSGVITARTGKVTLAAGTTFTLDLAGDRLVEIGVGSDKALVDQSGRIIAPGGTVQLSARAASAVVDGVINMSGVVRTASARQVGGSIILDGDNVSVSGTADASGTSGGTIAVTGNTINVSDTATLRADAQANGNGGTITAVASNTASYAGQYSARGGAAGGDGGKIETSGENITTAPDIRVDAAAPNGKAGEWLIDPLNVTIAAGSGGGLTGATVTVGAIQSVLAGGTSVSITTAQTGTDAGDLTLAASINAVSTGNAGLTLTGRHLSATGGSLINISGGALTLNVNAVNASATPPSTWINDAVTMLGAVSGGSTINLGAGVYTVASGYININRSNVTLNGVGQGVTILDARNASSYGLRISNQSNVTLNGFTLYGSTRANSYGLKAESVANLVLSNITSQGAAKSEFDLNGVIGGTLTNLTANGAAANGASFTSGAPTAGNGISFTDSQNITLSNSTTLNNVWGGLALYQSNFASGYTYQEKNITVAASNNFTETNPIYAEDQSAINDFGALNLAGYNYIVQSPNNPADVYSFFQKTQQGAIDLATNIALGNNNLTLASATVQGYAGNGEVGNNVFTVGVGTNGTAMSIGAALTAAASGATINVLNGTYVVPSGGTNYLGITKSLTLTGQSQSGTIIDATNASTYGIRVQADNVSLGNFTLLGSKVTGGYGIKVEPLSTDPNARLNNFTIRNVTINGSNKQTLDLNGVRGALIDHVTAENAVNGNGIAIIDSSNVTVTGSTTLNNAWGGLRIEEKNSTYNQQTSNVVVDATNSFTEATPVYLEDDSASQNFGVVTVQGYGFAIQAPSNPADIYLWLQNSQQAAINQAANLNLATATVQGWTGAGTNNHFLVGIGALTGGGSRALSIQAALNAAASGAVIDIASGSYGESLVQNVRATLNFGTVTLGGSYTLNSGAAGSVLSGALSAASINWAAPINLGGALSLDTSAGNGTIALTALDGSQALTLNAGSGAISLGALGATTRLGTVNDLSTTTLTGGTYNAANLNFAGTVTLTAALTTLNTNGGDITVAGSLLGSSDGAQSVSLLAGSGTGAAAQNGDISLQNVGATGLALGSMTVAGDNFGAQTVHLAGDYNSTLTGNQVFSSHTLNAGGQVRSAVGGDASGPINAGGDIGLSVGGQLSGAIAGGSIALDAGTISGATVSATQAIAVTAQSVQGSSLAAPTVTATADSFNAQVAASSSANISGTNVAGIFTGGSFTVSGSNSVNANIAANSTTVSSRTITGTYSGNAVSLSGSSSVNATVTSNTLSVQTPSGNLQGSWASVDTGSSGTLLLNQQASLSGNVGASQLVVENFTLPRGSSVTKRGDIILPQNLALALLSPAGADAPTVIVVQGVQQLGALLAQNYSAIVIDLADTSRKDRITD